MKQFRDLDSIEGSTFPELITADPKCETIVKNLITTDTPDPAGYFLGVV